MRRTAACSQACRHASGCSRRSRRSSGRSPSRRGGGDLEAIADAAVAVLGSEFVALRLLDPNDPSFTTVVAAARGLPGSARRAGRRAAVGAGVAGRAIAEGRLVVADGEDDVRLGTFALADVRAGMAAPVRASGAVVGSLAVGSSEERTYDEEDGELLQRLAELCRHRARRGEGRRGGAADLHGHAHRPREPHPLPRPPGACAGARRALGPDVTAPVDLDGFKLVNDSLGHIAGDRLLAQAAERLRGCLRRSDTAARLGGGEFGVLLSEGRGEARPRHVAERILTALAQPFDVHGRELAITASIGIASGSAEAGDLLRNADVAMERAKAVTGPSLAVFGFGMHAAMVEALELRATCSVRWSAARSASSSSRSSTSTATGSAASRRSPAGGIRPAATCRPPTSSRSPSRRA